MIINELLIEKYETQKRLSDLADHNLARYVANSHSNVQERFAKLGIKLKYGVPGAETPEVNLRRVRLHPSVEPSNKTNEAILPAGG